MNNWYCKSLGCGDSVFKGLKQLRVLRYQTCLVEQTPYRLVVDIETAETIVYFAPEFCSLAVDFGASPCRAPMLDGARLLDLDFKPLLISPDDAGFIASIAGHVAVTDAAIAV